MFHLLFALQEVMTYKNVVKYDGKKDKCALPLLDDFVVFQMCTSGEEGSTTNYYCAVDTCPSTFDPLPAECVEEKTSVEYALPVDDGFVVAFTRSKQANNFIDAVEDNEGDYVVAELVLGGKLSEEGKTAMQVIYCIMFWVAFLLIIATFVLALISITNCGCCRCCNSVKSIFPMRSTVGSA